MSRNPIQLAVAAGMMFAMLVLAFWMFTPSSTGPDPLPRRVRKQVKIEPVSKERWTPPPTRPKPRPKAKRVEPKVEPEPETMSPQERVVQVRCDTLRGGLDASLIFVREADASLDDMEPLIAQQYGRSALGLASVVRQWESFECEDLPERNEITDALQRSLSLDAGLSPEQEDKIRAALKMI